MERLNSNGSVASSTADAPPMSPTKVAQAEAIKKQGDIVRKLKEEKADKSKVGQQIMLNMLFSCSVHYSCIVRSIFGGSYAKSMNSNTSVVLGCFS